MKDVLVIGCGNLLRGDDGVGPILVRRLFELGLPSRMRLADGGTAGMDVAFAMEGASEVVLVDACRSGGKAGELYELPGEAVETPPLTGINMHAFRFDHAIAFGRWLLKERYPKKVTVFLIEAAQFEPGAPLSEAVATAMEELAHLLLQRYSDDSPPGEDCVEFTGKGYLVIPKHLAERHFPGDSLVALMRDSRLFLLPIRNQASGGLLMKHRNSKGDRSVFIDEVTRGREIKGKFKAVWQEADAALVVETNV